MRSILSKSILPVLILSAGSVVGTRAQTPPAQNPLLQQMLSQPPVDISSPVVATASFDPPVVRAGEKAVYRVTLNALETSIRWPGQIPTPGSLSARLTAHGQILQPGSNVFRPFTTFVYDVRARWAGLYTIPEFVIQVYGKQVTIPKADLETLEELPESHEPARQLLLECETTNVVVGETLTLRVLSFSGSNAVQSLTQVELNGSDFLENKSALKRSITTRIQNGKNVSVYTHETRVTPLAVGQLTLAAQGFSMGNRPDGQLQFLLLDSEPITVNARPLPAEDQMPGFTGAIGSFELDPPKLATNTVRVGDPVQLTVVIRSDDDLNRLVPPPPPRVKDWQTFPAVAAGIVGGAGRTNPGAVFNYTLIPLTVEARTTPAIPFSYFDSKKYMYADLTIPPAAVTVVANGTPSALSASQVLEGGELEPEKRLALSKLAPAQGRLASSLVPPQSRGWFHIVQLAPVLGFLGLLLWDRRRRYLERHPDIVRRRDARRQLQRQRSLLKRAAASRDAPGLTRCAVTAMRIACAPHFPANPRALVCGDILSLLDTTDQHGRMGDVARRFFAAADDSCFAASPQSHAEVLTLKAEVDELLIKLEEKL